MGYQRGENRWRGGGDQERWHGNRYEREGGSYGNWGSNRDRGDWDRGRERGEWRGGDWDRGRERSNWRGGDWDRDRERGEWRGGRDRDEDRGFFERAGETVRSWFGDDDDHGRYERERGMGGRYGREDERSYRPDSASTFGHQTDERYGEGGSRGYGDYREAAPGRPAETWAGSGFGGDYDRGRRFDRIDAGSTGTQGVHPMSSPVGGAYGGQYGEYGSSARSAAILRQSQQQGEHRAGFGTPHDRHYSEWRQRQIEELDRDYDEYRREHQSKFEQEFGGWRQKRQTQRQMLNRVTEHMEVVGSDGQRIGTVDKVKGDRIILTKNDELAGGRHHAIPCSWLDNVDDKVTVNKSAEEARRSWLDVESERALFERDDQGSEGPHMLNRSFAGTYDEKNG